MEFRGGLNRISCNLKHSVTLLMIFPKAIFSCGKMGSGVFFSMGGGGGVVWIATPSNMTFSNAIFVRGFVSKSEMS